MLWFWVVTKLIYTFRPGVVVMHQRRFQHARQNRLTKGIVLALAPAILLSTVSGTAFATCTTAGQTIDCDGTTNQNNFSQNINGVQMTLEAGGLLSVAPIVGGTALTLNGDGITLTNSGTIDPLLFQELMKDAPTW